MSVPDDQRAGPLTAVTRESAGRIKPDGRRVYRLAAPQLLWWGWVALAALGLGDALVQGQHGVPPRYLAGTLAITGVLFACALWPKVIADDGGLTVRNPLRSYRIPWSALREVRLGDSVEMCCARPPPKPDKMVYSWALGSSRRTRARAELRATLRGRPLHGQPAGYARMPDDARHVLRLSSAELIASELARLQERAQHGPADGALSVRWDWRPLAAIAVPAVAFALLMLL